MEAEEHQILQGCEGDGIAAGDVDSGNGELNVGLDVKSDTRPLEEEKPVVMDSVESFDNALLDLNMNPGLDDHSGLEDESKIDSEKENVKKAESDGRAVPTDGGGGVNEVVCDVGGDVGYKTLESEEKDRLSFVSSDRGKRVRCCDYALCRCLRRVPYATLFAFLLLAGGLALMTYEIIVIRETADDLFKGTVLNAETSAYRKGLNMLLWLLIALVAVIAIFGFFFLVLACFSSGPSKKNTCGQKFVKCVNRISISVVTIIAYLLCIAWIALSMALMLGLTFMLMVRSYCNSMNDTFAMDSCIDLAQYGMVPSKDDSTTTPQTPVPTPSMNNNTQTSICGDKLKDFCGMHEDIQLNVWLTVTASIIVIISLIHFLMALAANHTYMRVFRKGYRSVPRGTHAFPAFRYSDGELPIQEPLNVRDENTQF